MDAALNLPPELFSFGVRRMVAREVARASFEEVVEIVHDYGGAVIVLVDGEPRQLAAVQAEARRAGVKITSLLDGVHVIEYVWKAARALFGESTPAAEAWVSDRVLALLTGRSGGDIVKTIRWWASRRELAEPALRLIETACNYLADRTRTMKMAKHE